MSSHNAFERHGPMANNTSLTPSSAVPTGSRCNFRFFNDTEIWLQVTSYMLIILFSSFGNTVIISIVKKNRRMRSPTNYFIVNLCLANLMIMLLNVVPYAVGRISPHKGYGISGLAGTIVCKLHPFLISCTLNAAVLTLAVIAADRFIAIFFPLRGAINSRKAIWLIAATWFVPALPSTILLYVYRIYEFRGNSYCLEFWEPDIPLIYNTVYSAGDVILFYALPLLEIIVFYSAITYKIWMRKIPGQTTTANQQLEMKAKKNVLKMLIMVVLSFALLWLPSRLIMLISTFDSLSCFRTPTLRFMGNFLAYMNCAINPFIYIVFSQEVVFHVIRPTFPAYTHTANSWTHITERNNSGPKPPRTHALLFTTKHLKANKCT